METSELIKNIKKSRLSKSEKILYEIFENCIKIPNKKENIDEYVYNNITYIQIKHNKKVIYFNEKLFTYVVYNMYDSSVLNGIKNYFHKYNDYNFYSKYFKQKFDIYQISIF